MTRTDFHHFFLSLKRPDGTDNGFVPFRVLVDGEYREPKNWDEARLAPLHVGIADPRQEPVIVEVRAVRSEALHLRLSSRLHANNLEVRGQALEIEAAEKALWDGDKPSEIHEIHEGQG